MIRFFFLTWLFMFSALGPMPAAAQSVALRAGEHGDFTRLVLQIDGLEDWSLGRTDTGYGLALTRIAGAPAVTPDLTNTFDKITRNRVQDVRVDPSPDGHNIILIDLACDCHAKPFVFRRDYIVIDIFDGAAPADSPFETALNSPLGGLPATAPADTTVEGFDWLNTFAGLPKVKAQRLEKAEPLASDTALATDSPEPEAPPKPADPAEPDPIKSASPNPLETAAQLDDFRQSLIESLALAASSGRVELTPEEEQAPIEGAAETQNPPNIAGLNLGDGSPLSAQGAICPDKQVFDLAEWSSLLGENAYLRMTETRSRLLGEFDDPLPDAVKETVKANLALGFGHEARQLLTSFAPSVEGNEALIALSYIVESETPPNNPFDGFHSCASDAALWSLLAAPDGTPLPNLDANAVAMAFLELPPYLRVQLAQPVADRLIANGEEVSARMVRDATNRAGPAAQAVTPVLDAKLELAAEDPVEAENAIRAAPASAANEMILLVEARFRQKLPLSAEDRLALESYVFSEGSGEQGPALNRALALAMALDGEAAQALGLPQLDAQTKADLWDYVAETAGEAVVIEAAGRAETAEIATVSPATRTKISEKLLDIGLPDLARDWLPDPENQPTIMAAIHLAERDGLAALAEIANSASAPEDRAKLQAKAYRDLGDYPKASELLLSIGQVAEAERIQRWARVWDPTASRIDDLWRQIGLDAGRITSPATPVSLHLGQDLINRSLATREKVEALLSETSLSPPTVADPAAANTNTNPQGG